MSTTNDTKIDTIPILDCDACGHASEDKGQRCCPRCNSPFWRGPRLIENYPAQPGFVGSVACNRHVKFNPLQEIVREV